MNYNIRTNVSLLYFDPKPNKNNNNNPFSYIIVFISKSVGYLAITMVFCTCDLKVDSKTLIYINIHNLHSRSHTIRLIIRSIFIYLIRFTMSEIRVYRLHSK